MNRTIQEELDRRRLHEIESAWERYVSKSTRLPSLKSLTGFVRSYWSSFNRHALRDFCALRGHSEVFEKVAAEKEHHT